MFQWLRMQQAACQSFMLTPQLQVGSSTILWDRQQRQNIKLGTSNLDSVPLDEQKDDFWLLSKHQHVEKFRNEALWSWEGALAADCGGCGGERAWSVPVPRVLPLKLEAGRFTLHFFASKKPRNRFSPAAC